MVQYARFQRTIVDDAGNILPGAKVEVRSEATGALATLYSDRNGASGLSNPVTADSDGFAYFHVTGGAYRIRAYTGSSASPTYEKIWRYEGIGRGSEGDSMDGVSSGTTRTLNLGGSPLDTTADPGGGGLTFNNATIASVTEIAVDVLNLGGGNESDWLAALGAGASTNKSRLEIRNAADPLVDFAIFDVTAAAVQGSPPTFYRLTVTHVASGGALADDQIVNITSAPAGSKGDLGSDGTDPGVLLNWDSGTTDADPGSGDIRASNASLASAGFLYVSILSRAGNSITTFLANLGRSTNTVRLGEIVLTRPSDDTQAIFDLDSVVADGSPATYYKLGVSNHSGATSFTAADPISFQFTADGNKGADGAGLVDSVNGYTGDVVVEAVDAGALAGLAVRAATTGVIDIATALNNGDTLDGVSLVTGDLVLVKDQSGGSPDIAYENGIYVVGAVPARHARFADYNQHCGGVFSVQEGTANADTVWQCVSDQGGTIDSSALNFLKSNLPGVSPYQSAPLSVTANAGALTIAQEGSTSLVIPSGAELGVVASEAIRLWVVRFEDGELGVINCFQGSDTAGVNITIHPLTPWAAAPTSAAAIGTGSDSAGVIYATSDQTGNAYNIVGFIEWDGSGIAVAGTWTTTNLLRTQLFGPGVPLPGATIQRKSSTATNTDSTSSATFIATTSNLSITLSSAANCVLAEACFTLGCSAAGVNAAAKLSRGTTNNTNLFGPEVKANTSGGSLGSPGVCTGLDKPNTTSSQTYTFQLKLLSGSGNAQSLNDQGFVLQEVMT